MLGCH